MPDMAIVAALEREVRPLIRHWQRTEMQYGGRSFRFFLSENAVLVCGGIGAEAARRATEAVIVLFAPKIVYSVGFAGALDTTLNWGRPTELKRWIWKLRPLDEGPRLAAFPLLPLRRFRTKWTLRCLPCPVLWTQMETSTPPGSHFFLFSGHGCGAHS
jgi:hypothetical protein